jgi:predicted transposase/invertase (TIGR01784 family)
VHHAENGGDAHPCPGVVAMPIGIDPTIDFAFKRVLGNPDHADITLHFLNAVMGGKPRITRVEFTNPFLEKQHFGDKLSILDILATDEHGRQFDIEMQTTLPAELPQRLIYYVALLYASRLGAGQEYATLRPAICICVMDEILFPQSPHLHQEFRLRTADGLEFSENLQIRTLELPKYRRPENNEVIESAVEKWAYFVRFAALSTSDELTARLADREFAAAAGVLEMIAKTPEERYWYELSLKSARDEVSRLKGAEEKGHAEGQKSGALMGQIQMLQSLNGEAVSTMESLDQFSTEQLQRLVDEGQAKLRQRGLPPEA